MYDDYGRVTRKALRIQQLRPATERTPARLVHMSRN
jgi:hypothetical protein